jgi:methyltransferase (TIGR00027 family)
VAAERALLSELGVLADPWARTMLTPFMALMVDGARRLPARVRGRSVTLAGLAARVLWFDAQVVAALEAGVPQIAVIGAGYDSRAWRFGRIGVRFFELDAGPTQADKRAGAPGPELAPIYVEADLRMQSAAAALRENGLDQSRPVLFVVEGVTMYLDERIVRDQLSELAVGSAPGSRLAVDFVPPPGAGTSVNHRQNRLQRLARAGSGESFRCTVERDGAVALVTATGWKVDETTSVRQAARALVPPAARLPVDSVNEHKTLLAASTTNRVNDN